MLFNTQMLFSHPNAAEQVTPQSALLLQTSGVTGASLVKEGRVMQNTPGNASTDYRLSRE
jgi:hypothetical protein